MIAATVVVPEVRDWFRLDEPAATASTGTADTAQAEVITRKLRQDNEELRASNQELSRKLDVLHGDMREMIEQLRKSVAVPQQQLDAELSNLKSEVQHTEATQAGADQTTSGQTGFAASQARFMQLSARKSDIDLHRQYVNQARIGLANIASQLFAAAEKEPPSEDIQRKIDAIQELDKKLELQLRQLDAQADAAQTEIDAVSRVIGRNIESAFKTFG